MPHFESLSPRIVQSRGTKPDYNCDQRGLVSKMNIAATPRSSYKTFTVPTAKARLEQCWKFDINWELYPDAIREVYITTASYDVGYLL